MNTRIVHLKELPTHRQLGPDPEPPGQRFDRLCPVDVRRTLHERRKADDHRVPRRAT